MISAQARAGFEQLFVAALASRLPRSPDDACTVTRVAAAEAAGAAPSARAASGSTLVVLTISSIRFRLLFMLEAADDPRIHAYYAPNGDGKRFREAFLEVANLCCGLMSQGLQAHFPDLGMSTPYVLDTGCLAHLASLKPGYLDRHAVTLNDAVTIVATICVCAHADIDFVPDLAPAEASEGELELF